MAKWGNMRTVSGGAVASKSHKMLGCEQCNWMEMRNSGKTKSDSLPDNEHLKTGSDCPRCSAKGTVRIFDSKAELTRAQELKRMVFTGDITDLCYQTRFQLNAPDFETGEHKKVCDYVADFTYNETNREGITEYIVEDVKGNVITDVAKLKLKWFEIQYGIPVRIVIR